MAQNNPFFTSTLAPADGQVLVWKAATHSFTPEGVSISLTYPLPATGANPLTTQGGNTLDDGSGNLTVAGTTTIGTTNLIVQPNSSGTVIQLRVQNGNNNNALVGQAGAWQTRDSAGANRNTLDDGAGNMTIAGNFTLKNNVEVFSGAASSIQLFPNNGSFNNSFGTNGTGWVTRDGTGALRNTLDDGSGNMTVAGHMQLSGGSSYVQIPNASAAGNGVYFASVNADTNPRWQVNADGATTWGSGSATQDLRIFRSGASTLTMDNGSGGAMTLALTTTSAASATAGAATLPANPVGFIVVTINGTSRKIPYYAT